MSMLYQGRHVVTKVVFLLYLLQMLVGPKRIKKKLMKHKNISNDFMGRGKYFEVSQKTSALCWLLQLNAYTFIKVVNN